MWLPAAVAAEMIAADSESWRFSNDQAGIAEFAGRSAIRIRNGAAFLDDIDLENGQIEFDVYVTGERSFVYLSFRGQSEFEYEDLYLRPHKSGLPDAVQYAPVYQGRSAWQLYHGERGTAAAVIPRGEWVTVRLELSGPSARVWVGDPDEPVMEVSELGRPPAGGWIAFRGFVPGAGPDGYAAYFSNLTVTHAGDDSDARAEPPPLPDGQVTEWRVSPAFDAPAGPVTKLPEGLDRNAWSPLPVQSNGAVEFLRWRDVPADFEHWAVVAETTLRSEGASTCAMHLGFSDEITLFVNGQPLLYRDAGYRFGDRRQDGVMHPDQVIAFLPLRAGDNIVRAVVADQFGGWGLSARIGSCE
jgi:hypothetical protein